MRQSNLVFFLATAAFAASPTLEIKVDQAGYLPDAPKFAIVAGKEAAGTFIVRRGADSSIALRGKLSDPIADPDTGDRVQTADFSTVKQRGTYYLEVAGIGRSWDFAIAPDVYDRAFYLAARSYYGQRCGIAVDLGSEFPGYKHDACHLEGAYHATSGKSGTAPSTGGWHDAGDYGATWSTPG